MTEMLEQILEKCAPYTRKGKLADYIPELTKANPDDFGIYIISKDKGISKAGDYQNNLQFKALLNQFFCYKHLWIMA